MGEWGGVVETKEGGGTRVAALDKAMLPNDQCLHVPGHVQCLELVRGGAVLKEANLDGGDQ